ncbi:MAG TPA: hypothetical protein VLC96_18185, partial [Flavobacterium sp.]|nr:hypothetical protein [Flavobacterium sp.]
MKTKLFFSVLALFLVHGFGFGQSTFISLKTGNWNDPTTWYYSSTGVSDADGIPDSDDEVILTGSYTITVDTYTTCDSIIFQNSTLDIALDNVLLANKVVVDASNSQNITATIQGLGTLMCNSFDVGDLSDPKSANYTTIAKSFANLSIYGDLTIYSSSYDGTYTNNAIFSLEKGTTTVNGQIKTINENTGTTPSNPNVLSTATFTTANNLGRRVLSLGGANPFLLSTTGTNIIMLSGMNTEVLYNALFVDQAILNTEYYDLTLDFSGIRRFPNSPVNIKNALTLNRVYAAYPKNVDLGSKVTHTAGSLIVRGSRGVVTEQVTGTWGGITSSATNINEIYFLSNTGILKVGIPCTGPTKTWDGSGWTGGTPPTSSDQIIFAGDFSSFGDLYGCNCKVNSGNVTINTGNTLTLLNEVAVAGGTLTFENNSSFVQKNAAVNTGVITYKRNSNGMYKNDYTLWSSPVSGLTLHDVSPNTSENGFQLFDNDVWSVNYNGVNSMSAGAGVAIMAPKTYSDVTTAVFSAEFKGVPNNGDILFNIQYHGLWHLIGNPYPSALDYNEFIKVNNIAAGMSETIYFWVNSSKPNTANTNVNKYKSSDFACYNATGGVSTDNGIVPDIEYIRSGQGFFVFSDGYAPIIFKNSMRVGGNNSQFFKLSKKTDIDKSRLWLNLTNEEGLFKQILIGYVPGATKTDNGVTDSFDGIDFNNNKYVDFYSMHNPHIYYRHLAIQGLPAPFVDTDEVPLGFMVNLEKQPAMASQFKISISHTDGDLVNQPIYLYDKTNNTTNDLRKGGYTFSSVDGTFDDRFVIKFINNDLGVNDFDKTSKDLIVAVKNKT